MAKRSAKPKSDSCYLPPVRVTLEQKAIIAGKAKAAGLTVTEYQRNASLGHPIRALHEIGIVGEVRDAAVTIRESSTVMSDAAAVMADVLHELRLIREAEMISPEIEAAIADALARHDRNVDVIGRAARIISDIATKTMTSICNWCVEYRKVAA
jgi:hypothetical protein